jgi:hypothetical protein
MLLGFRAILFSHNRGKFCFFEKRKRISIFKPRGKTVPITRQFFLRLPRLSGKNTNIFEKIRLF